MDSGNELIHVVQRAELLEDGAVITDIVAVVIAGRIINGTEPERINTQVL